MSRIRIRTFKKMFGEYLYSLKWDNMVRDVKAKVATYNRLIDMEVVV